MNDLELRKVIEKHNELIRSISMSVMESKVLSTLDSGLTTQLIAKKTGYGTSSVTRIIRSLVDKGWVKKQYGLFIRYDKDITI